MRKYLLTSAATVASLLLVAGPAAAYVDDGGARGCAYPVLIGLDGSCQQEHDPNVGPICGRPC